MKSKDRAVGNGENIYQLFKKLKGEFSFDRKSMQTFVEFLNLLGENIYTKKTE